MRAPCPLDSSLSSTPLHTSAQRMATASPPVSSSRTAADLVLAAELQARGEASDALSMMVSSMARMVQAGRSCDSRWKAT